MKIHCFYCSKPVSTEVPDGTILRAIAICPECIEAGKDTEEQDAEIARLRAELGRREQAQDAIDQLQGAELVERQEKLGHILTSLMQRADQYPPASAWHQALLEATQLVERMAQDE